MERELLLHKQTQTNRTKSLNRKEIDAFVSHLGPHFDEYLAEEIVTNYGSGVLALSPQLKYEYISSIVPPDYYKQHPRKLFFGVAGGPLDDHGKLHAKSCCQLAAEKLGVEKRPELLILLRLASERDKKAATNKNPFTVSRVINIMHRYDNSRSSVYDPDAHMKVRAWAQKIIRAIIKSERELLARIKAEVQNSQEDERQNEVRSRFMKEFRPWIHLTVKVCSTLLGDQGEAWLKEAQFAKGKQDAAYKVALEVSKSYLQEFDSEERTIRTLMVDGSDGVHADYEIEFDVVSRTHKADVVFVRNVQGNNFIGINAEFPGNLKKFVRMLRLAEAAKRGIEILHEQLTVQGTLPQLEQWHVHEFEQKKDRYRRVYNGAASRPWIEPSILTFEEIQKILLESIGVREVVAH
jgi:hypothetical protein